MNRPESDSPAAGPVDDWESHWREYDESAQDNPAQRYRRTLISRAIGRAVGRDRRPRTILDVGSGQGDLLAQLGQQHPNASLAGLELSSSGITAAEQRVPGARFVQVDLASPAALPTDLERWADVVTCSEVLEHVDRPEVLLRNAARALAPAGTLVITVPGGPRTAFDRHIGHRRHFDRATLTTVIDQAGLEPVEVKGHGFPFFNLYKLVVLVRGEKVVADVATSTPPSRLAAAVMGVFGLVLRPSLCSSRWGWQMVAVVRRRADSGPTGPSDSRSSR